MSQKLSYLRRLQAMQSLLNQTRSQPKRKLRPLLSLSSQWIGRVPGPPRGMLVDFETKNPLKQ